MYSLILHGRRSVELQKWRVSLNILQNAFAFSNSFSSANVNPQGNTFTVSYLVESLGLTTKLADKVNPDSVLNLLRSNGFEDSQISRIVTTYPRLLVEDAETSLRPKLQALQHRGASSSELAEIVSKVPKILEKRVGKSLSLYYDFVKDIMQQGKLSPSWTEGKVKNRIRNISVLKELGVPQNLLFSLLISRCQPVCGKEKFDETLKKVVDMGFDPTKSKFVEALHVVYEMSDKTIEEKVNVYKRLGFSEEDVWKIFKKWPFFLKFSEEKILESVDTFVGLGFSRDEYKIMIKRFPQCFGYSAESLKKKFEFLVKKMKWPPEAVVLVPSVFGYSLEKRILPRCNVIKVLLSKGLIRGGNPPMSSVFVCTDEEFVSRYVMKQGKLVPELMAMLTGQRVS
ncbi:hypothetical protein F2Q69_00007675 [Brassica cretica]|uniref:Uncharacterized protein n=1 Tax=Brassica cretica TaxID=69181 RepID=A0A8S9P5W4_BRACR|nr:hypothetical protein F2Q69_00007675 [Brassica cretica]